jgi:hypothetical protein
MSWIAVGVGATVATYKLVDSANKSSKAKKLAASNKRPVYQRPQEVDDAYNMALSEINNTHLDKMHLLELMQY